MHMEKRPGGFANIAGITAHTQKLVYIPTNWVSFACLSTEPTRSTTLGWVSQGHHETYQYPSNESFPVHLVEQIIIILFLTSHLPVVSVIPQLPYLTLLVPFTEASGRSREKKSNFAGFSGTNSRKKRPISREFRRNFRGQCR